jgi:NAD(P)-dependent dehydrogenase (short-subunit alcohol dehydrogenase family)
VFRVNVPGLTRAPAIEWAEYGMRVLSITPPFISKSTVQGIPDQLTSTLAVHFPPEQNAGAIMGALAGSGNSYLVGWTSFSGLEDSRADHGRPLWCFSMARAAL